jgi:hypothetical protein
LTARPAIGLDGRVPKYDAFGREIGEDTLAGLGGDEQAVKGSDWEARIVEARAGQEAQQDAQRAVPEPEPVVFTGAPQVPVQPPPQPTPPPQRSAVSIPTGMPSGAMPRHRRGRGGLGCLFSLVFLGVILVGPIIAIVSFVGDTSDTVRRAIDDATKGIPGSPGDDNAPPPQGLHGRSLIRAENLAPALRQIQSDNPGKLGDLVVRADRMSATLITRRTHMTSDVLDYKGNLSSSEGQDIGVAPDTVPWEAIDPKVPQRLARLGAGKAGANDISYVIARPPTVFQTGKVAWFAYYNSGRIVQADASGKPVRRISP